MAERLVRDGLECALLVCELAALTDRELESKHADDRIDRATRDEPGSGEQLERPRVDDVVSRRPTGCLG